MSQSVSSAPSVTLPIPTALPQPTAAPAAMPYFMQYDPTNPFANPHCLISSIEPFSGTSTQNVEDFLRTIELTSSLGNWSEQLKISIALSRLRGTAVGYIQMSATPHSWQNMRERLLQRFGANLNTQSAFTELVACQQKAGERVAEYTQRLFHLGNLALSDFQNENVQRQFIINGFRPSIRSAVMIRNPSSFNEAFSFAQNCEIYDTASQTARASRTYVIKDSTSSRPTTPPNPSPSSLCRYCKAATHVIDQCPIRPRRQNPPSSLNYHSVASAPNVTTYCRYCKSTSHLIEHCRIRPIRSIPPSPYGNNRSITQPIPSHGNPPPYYSRRRVSRFDNARTFNNS